MLLAGILVILSGLGGVAHARSDGCIGLGCESHMQLTEHASVANNSIDKSTLHSHHDPDSSGTSECNPSICQAVILLAQNKEAAQDQREIDPEFQIGAQAKPIEPDNPYKPPDL
ncbi:hypothetical protein [Ruegeria sp. HKCCSP335]|uniref:hypothetical protein n=1 Tax=Ruegeria sp. HKCCSP335 TaxID=2794833 RepID=UPI001AE1907C|nr:hypothetical protein [Ruegeria sp. HKCCSP335]